MLVLARIAVVAALLLVSTGPAYSQLSFDPSSPEESGVDGQLISDLAAAISGGTFSEIHGLLIVRGGRVLHESYYRGNRDYFDDNLNRVTPGDTLWDASMPHYVASVTKSMTSAAVGIALADHSVSVDSTVRDLIPNYRNRFFGLRETGITVRHLLTMTGGHDWDEWNTDDLTQMWRSGQDFIHFALAPAMAHDPGTFWRYNSGEANVLMGVVDALSGDAAGFIQERLFDPLEIGDYEWRTQPGGLPEAAARLFMRPRDLAKVGRLYLNRGLWNGEQVIPEAWVDSSLAVQVSTRPLTEWDYGYLWWARTVDYTQDGVRRTQQYFAAEGDGGNLIAVFPGLDLAVVVTQGNYSDFGTYDRQNQQILADYILPATFDLSIGVEEAASGEVPRTMLSVDVFPNPATGRTTIRYSVAEPGRREVQIYDVLGREVARITDGELRSGSNQLTIETGSLPTGTYLVRVVQGSRAASRPLVLVR
jgi:CubicO group peptidase (beta-lactamase class C family)